MQFFALSAHRKLLLTVAAAALLALASTPSRAQEDAPLQAGRISAVSGAVSIQQVGSDDWGQAVPNFPLGPGDRVFTDSDGRAEIQVGKTLLHLGPRSDVSVVELSTTSLSFGVAQGSIHVITYGVWPGQTLHFNTPNGSAGIVHNGEFRVDVLPGDDATVVTNYSNAVSVAGAGGFYQDLYNGQALELVGSNPVYPQWLQPAGPDDLDVWSQRRDEMISHSASFQYVSAEIPGAYELDAAGTWQPGTPYGNIWFPNDVPGGWAPYHYGHWVNHAPWGWVWVEDESWGYAPFHYGRWVSFNGRWGWVPGAPAAHPVWSPALVVFAGGIHVGGAGVSAWFPLGPGEPYRPWYHASPAYIDQVNISNISESPRVHIQTTYVNVNVVNITYVNRANGYSAMNTADFAAGRPAHQASVVVDVHAFDHVQVLERPEAQPSPHPFAGHPPVRPVPVKAERPAVINESGNLVSAKPGVRPMAPPVKPAPQVRPLPGRAVVAPPPGAKTPPTAPGASAAPGAKPAPAAAPAARPQVQPEGRGAKPTAPVEATPAQKPGEKPAAQPTAKPAAEPAGKPAAQPTAQPAQKPAAKPAAQPTAKPAAEPAGKPPAQPAAKPAAKPAAQPAAKPAAPEVAKPQVDKKAAKDKKKDEKKPEN
jgi:hypothetical protein